MQILRAHTNDDTLKLTLHTHTENLHEPPPHHPRPSPTFLPQAATYSSQPNEKTIIAPTTWTKPAPAQPRLAPPARTAVPQKRPSLKNDTVSFALIGSTGTEHLPFQAPHCDSPGGSPRQSPVPQPGFKHRVLDITTLHLRCPVFCRGGERADHGEASESRRGLACLCRGGGHRGALRVRPSTVLTG